jgi:hypothetical protein
MKNKTMQFPADAFNDALLSCRETLDEFRVERTGYSARIVSERGTWMFTNDRVNPKLFTILRKLREEISAKGIPSTQYDQPTYNNFDGIRTRPTLPPEAWSVDLSSAYAHALFHLGLISPELFHQLKELDKVERLRVVGMLATTKTHFRYVKGRPVSMHIEQAETRGAFFAACDVVGYLMEVASTAPGFLFFWVDGIYYDRPAPEVVDFFEGEGFPCKVERVSNLTWSANRKFLLYDKDGERKFLAVPSPRMPAPAWIENILNTPTT